MSEKLPEANNQQPQTAKQEQSSAALQARAYLARKREQNRQQQEQAKLDQFNELMGLGSDALQSKVEYIERQKERAEIAGFNAGPYDAQIHELNEIIAAKQEDADEEPEQRAPSEAQIRANLIAKREQLDADKAKIDELLGNPDDVAVLATKASDRAGHPSGVGQLGSAGDVASAAIFERPATGHEVPAEDRTMYIYARDPQSGVIGGVNMHGMTPEQDAAVRQHRYRHEQQGPNTAVRYSVEAMSRVDNHMKDVDSYLAANGIARLVGQNRMRVINELSDPEYQLGLLQTVVPAQPNFAPKPVQAVAEANPRSAEQETVSKPTAAVEETPVEAAKETAEAIPKTTPARKRTLQEIKRDKQASESFKGKLHDKLAKINLSERQKRAIGYGTVLAVASSLAVVGINTFGNSEELSANVSGGLTEASDTSAEGVDYPGKCFDSENPDVSSMMVKGELSGTADMFLKTPSGDDYYDLGKEKQNIELDRTSVYVDACAVEDGVLTADGATLKVRRDKVTPEVAVDNNNVSVGKITPENVGTLIISGKKISDKDKDWLAGNLQGETMARIADNGITTITEKAVETEAFVKPMLKQIDAATKASLKKQVGEYAEKEGIKPEDVKIEFEGEYNDPDVKNVKFKQTSATYDEGSEKVKLKPSKDDNPDAKFVKFVPNQETIIPAKKKG